MQQRLTQANWRVHFLGSGSAGNATLIRVGTTRILVDCGFSARQLGRRLETVGESLERIDAVLVTHEHQDHVAGLAMLARRKNLAVHLTPGTARRVSFGTRAACERVSFQPGGVFPIGSVQVQSFATSHDAADPVGFVFQFPDGTRLGLATDLGTSSPEVERLLAQCHLLALECNHDPDMLRHGPYPWVLKRRIASAQGHLSNPAAADVLGRVASERLRGVFAIHRSRTNNRPELVEDSLRPVLSRLGQPVDLHIVDQDHTLSYPDGGQLSLRI